MIRTYTVDSNKFWHLIDPSDDEIKDAIAFALDGTGNVLAVGRPFGMQYFEVQVDSLQDAGQAVVQGFYNVGFTSAILIRTEGGVTSTNVLKESVLGAAEALAPALAPLSRYVLVLAIAVAVIVIGIFLMKGGKAN